MSKRFGCNQRRHAREQVDKSVDALAQRLEGLVAVSVTQGFIQQFAAQLRNGEAV